MTGLGGDALLGPRPSCLTDSSMHQSMNLGRQCIRYVCERPRCTRSGQVQTGCNELQWFQLPNGLTGKIEVPLFEPSQYLGTICTYLELVAVVCWYDVISRHSNNQLRCTQTCRSQPRQPRTHFRFGLNTWRGS